MTRVDFYVLDGAAPGGRERFACRLAETAYERGHRVYIHAPDGAAAARLDDLLWTFRAGSFVPHDVAGPEPDPDVPIHIGHEGEPADHEDVLINLAADVPRFFSRFARVAEVIDGDEGTRQQGRERFRFYRERGYPLESHNIDAG